MEELVYFVIGVTLLVLAGAIGLDLLEKASTRRRRQAVPVKPPTPRAPDAAQARMQLWSKAKRGQL